MPSYQYKAVDDAGRYQLGKVEAVNEIDLEARLDRMGLDLVNCKILKQTGGNVTGLGVKRRDLITFCFHMEQTSRAGVPMLESLEDMRDSTDNPRLKEVLAAMMESVEGGMTLSQSMHQYPAVFGDVFSNLVRAGEQSGEMSEVFRNLSDTLKWQDEQASYTK
ncbi:MAG: type II secretion system F family protein, partial [Gammaproteobacteria bacterium]